MNLTRQQRRNLGEFYTPKSISNKLTKRTIIQYILSQLNQTLYDYNNLDQVIYHTLEESPEIMENIITNLKILDCSTGNGRFLQSSLEILADLLTHSHKKSVSNKKNFKESISFQILKNNLYGIDINQKAVSECIINLLKNINQNYRVELKKILSRNILIGNFLDLSLQDFETLYSDDKFQIILGNPPWGSKLSYQDKIKYHQIFPLQSSKRNLNIFELFIYQSTKLIDSKNRGMLALLLPKNFARSNQYTHVRKFLLDNYQILNINFYGLFENVTQEFISLTARYGHSVNQEHKILVDNKNKIDQSIYYENYDYIFTQNYNSNVQQTLTRIKENSSPLSKYMTIKRGEELSKRGEVMYCPNCQSWVQKSSRKRRIICPACQIVIEEKNLEIQFLIKNTFNEIQNQPILTGDDFEAFFIRNAHYIDPSTHFRSKKDPKIYFSPKLVLQKIKRYPCAALDMKSVWTTQNVYILRLKPEYEINTDLLFYILSILNSILYKWFYETQFNLGSNFTNAISISNLKRLPIKNPDPENKIYRSIVFKTKLFLQNISADKRHILDEINKHILEYYGCKTFPPIGNLHY
ncbi:TaqI-like C-terminal specificity domain-containing protein [Candidatus Hodarchaeum mangrovi]